ncbi:ribosomal protein S5, C-terminal domain-containing protein [Cladochytrium replicatum]|nr:ribosomal protein S5, C-terminal domain-containing protein [Cladochytrium replicatum]
MSKLPGNSFIKRVLHVRRVSRVTAGGKSRSVSALVVVGNGNGAAGYGQGRGLEAAQAIQKATERAYKSMIVIPRYDNRTIFSNMEHNYKGVRLMMYAAPPGYGVVANDKIHEVCRCAGIADMSAKVYGSRNPMNVIKATFDAFTKQTVPQQIAKARGCKVMEVGIFRP